MSELFKAMAALKQEVVKSEVNEIVNEGKSAFMKETYRLNKVDAVVMSAMKGENSSVLTNVEKIYEGIVRASREMVELKNARLSDEKYYASFWGQTLESVLEHKADSTKPVRKDPSVTSPKERELRVRRMYYAEAIDKINMNLLITKKQLVEYDMFSIVEDCLNGAKAPNKIVKDVVTSIQKEMEDRTQIQIELDNCVREYTDHFESCRNIVDFYSFSYDEAGRKIFDKGNDYNSQYSQLTKEGRTLITKFDALAPKGIEMILDCRKIKDAKRVFKVKG